MKLEVRMTITTFAELMEVENPTFETLSEILDQYAMSGQTIIGQVVISIIKKIELTPGQKNDLANSAKFGAWKQANLSHPTEEQEYRQVVAALV